MEVNELPKYPQTKELEITDYHLVSPLLKTSQLPISDYNFTNIFAWKKTYNYEISTLNGMIVSAGCFNGKHYILPPIGDRNLAAKTAFDALSNSEAEFVAVAPYWLAEEMKEMPGIEVIEDRKNWDYVYSRNDLAELPGSKYHAKKNLASQFRSTYKYQVEELNTSTCKEAMEFSHRWCEMRDCESDEGLKQEKCAIYQMLTYFEVLKLHGFLIRVDGEIVGLIMGEELLPDTYVIHVEKGDHHLKGIYQTINQELAMRLPEKYKWINREQDMGIEGLRRAKQSYYPDHMVEKFQVYYTDVIPAEKAVSETLSSSGLTGGSS